jgi:16S rRNA (cytosine967-C5)-methyltransferase
LCTSGKTCHILEQQTDLTECVAVDVDPTRLTKVNENLSRLRLKATVMTGNALKPNEWWDGKPFDRILLDAPCSATGVIRRHPDIKLLRTATDIQAIVALQSEILSAIWPLLSPSGIMLYATCSILPEENEQQISTF